MADCIFRIKGAEIWKHFKRSKYAKLYCQSIVYYLLLLLILLLLLK